MILKDLFFDLFSWLYGESYLVSEEMPMQHSPAVLTIGLDAETLAQLEKAAALELQSLEEYVRDMFAKHLRSEDKPARKLKGARSNASQNVARAPLDEFLPEGADPFLHEDATQARADFEHMQTLLRFAGANLR